METSVDGFITLSIRLRERVIARVFNSAGLNAVHYKMNSIPAAKIGDFVMCFKCDGEIRRVWPRERYAEMADLFAHAFQWLRMEIKMDTCGSITDELSFQPGSDKALIQYLHRKIGSGTARNRMRQCACQSHADACFRIDGDLNWGFLRGGFVLGIDKRDDGDSDEQGAENDVPHYAISHSFAIAS